MRMNISSLLPVGFALLLATPAFADLTDQQKTVPLEVDSTDKSLAKVVLIAGAPSNKPGQHEYFAGCALMYQWLKQQPGVWPVMVAEGWPKNEAVLDGAKAIVIYMDGGTKLALLEPARWAKIKGLVEAGAGLSVLHQAVEVPEAQAADYKAWLGAVWQKDIGCRGHWDMTFDTFPTHEATRGVVPFTAVKDGWLYNLHFADKGVTPLLTGLLPDTSRSTADARSHAGRPEVIAWAFERENGGRSIGFTGCDLHASWGIESQRRFMVNSILWTARLPVPEKGATVPACSTEDLALNLDRKALGVKKPAAAAAAAAAPTSAPAPAPAQ